MARLDESCEVNNGDWTGVYRYFIVGIMVSYLSILSPSFIQRLTGLCPRLPVVLAWLGLNGAGQSFHILVPAWPGSVSTDYLKAAQPSVRAAISRPGPCVSVP